MAHPRDAGKPEPAYRTTGRTLALVHPRSHGRRPVRTTAAGIVRRMSPSLRLSALDATLVVRFVGPGTDPLVDAATRAWSRCLTDAPGARTADPLDVAAPTDASDAGLGFALQLLTQQVTLRLIEAQIGRLLMLHAGAVSHPVTGDSLVFVAPGGTGKTTLARLLGRRYGYLTDETVGIDSTGRVHPYPKPLSLRVPGVGHKQEASPDDLGLAPAHPAPTVRRVIVLARPPGHSGAPRVAELGTLDAVQAILPETSSLAKLPRPLRTLADLTERCGPVLRCSYAEADDLAALAADLIGEVP